MKKITFVLISCLFAISSVFSNEGTFYHENASTTVTSSIRDFAPPVITSGIIGNNLEENTGIGGTVYEITTAAGALGTMSYAIDGVDVLLLSVDSETGFVYLDANPDHETKFSYSFTVTATDSDGSGGTSAATTVTFSITNVDEVAPTITSAATGTDIAENSGGGQTIYTITADANDGGAISGYTLGGTDAGLLSVDLSGVVTLTADPDYENKNSYSFTVTATDGAGTSAATAVTFNITNLDDVVPTITSAATGTDIAENSGGGQTIYTITVDANDGGTIASYTLGGTDAGLLSVNSSGVVTLIADPDYENKNSYSFTVTATDGAGTSAATTVTFNITNVDEAVPTITSSATITDIAENSGPAQQIYTITADANDGGTIASYTLGGTDAGLLSVNASGVVTLIADPNYENKNSYSFTVTATDGAGTSAPTTVTFGITNVDPPIITSGATGI
jgi:hypothetical protein